MNYNKVDIKDNMRVEKIQAEVVTERERLKPITKASRQKKGLITRLVHGTLGPDGFKQIRTNLMEEIFLPTIKRMLYEGITSTAGLLLYHDGTPPRATGRLGEFVRGSKTTDYGSVSTTKASNNVRSVRGKLLWADEYIINTREGIGDVMANLKALANQYGKVSVADYYDQIEDATSTFADRNYGWYKDTLEQTTVRIVRDGFIIQFPPLELIN